MRHNILMMGPLPTARTEELKENFNVFKLWEAKDPEAFLSEIRNDVHGMVSVFGVPVSAKLINALPNLEIIAHDSVGYDNIDISAARARNIVVTNVGGVTAEDVSDLAIAMMLSVFRRVVEGDIYVRSGLWAKRGALPLGSSPRGRMMGIVGLGAIGRALARKAQAFGMTVAYHGPRKKDDVDFEYFAALEDMAAACDVLALTCPGGEATRGIINAKIFRKMKKTAVLINVARGSVVVQEDLIDALQERRIGGAGLDVFWDEPDVPPALCRLDTVVLQPHQGSATAETRSEMRQMVVANLNSYFTEAKVLTPV